MLITLLLWLYIGTLSFFYGLLSIHLFGLNLGASENHPTHFSVISILGICTITVLTGFLSFFIKIGLLANLLIAIGGIIIAWKQLNKLCTYAKNIQQFLRKKPLISWLLLITVFTIGWIIVTIEPQHYDTGLYHAQAIRWLEEYPIVPGLGNLHGRLAFNSAWFLPSAFFSFSFLGIRSFHVLNGYLLLVVATYTLHRSTGLLYNKFTLGNIVSFFLMVINLRIFAWELSSPGTDLPAAMLIWMIFLLSLEEIDEIEIGENIVHFGILSTLSIFVITIKISTLPILLIPFYFLLRGFKDQRRFALIAIAVCFIFIPWCIRNIVMSGYLVYPIAETNLVSLDWQIPINSVREEADWIKSWARIPFESKDIVLNMPATVWIPYWYQQLSVDDRLILYLIGIGSIILLAMLIFKSIRMLHFKIDLHKHWICYVTGIIGILFWFILAPNFRFGYGFLIIFIALLYAPILRQLLLVNRSMTKSFVFLIHLSAIIYLIWSFGLYKINNYTLLSNRLILPLDYPSVIVKPVKWGNLKTNTPVGGDQCWYAPLPCTPVYNLDVQLRGDDLTEGFYDRSR